MACKFCEKETEIIYSKNNDMLSMDSGTLFAEIMGAEGSETAHFYITYCPVCGKKLREVSHDS